MKTELPLKPACPSGRGAEGFILPVTLMVMGLISLLGATFLTVSATEHTIASNEVNASKAFNIAEAGLERAKARLKTATEPLNNFLSGTSPGPNLYTGVSFDGGNYTVVISDDNDDANQNTDINNRVFIRSTGTYRTAQKQLVALVEVSPPLPTPLGAAEALTTGSYEIGAATPGPGGSFDGRDWNAPADPSACTDIANCGTLTANPATYGGFGNDSSGAIDLRVGGTMYGTGCLSGACGTSAATASVTRDTSVPLTRWDSTIDALKSQATRTLNVSGAWSGTYTWGTPAAPEITVINTTRLDWSSTVNGAGVLIIESPGVGPPMAGVYFQSTAVLNWQGLVIIRSPGSTAFELPNSTGRIRIFGQVVNRSASTAEIELHGPGFVKYSSAAMNMIRQRFLPGFTVRSWQEVSL